MAKKKKLYAGVGAKCTIFTRFIHPRVTLDDNNYRSIDLKDAIFDGYELLNKVSRK